MKNGHCVGVGEVLLGHIGRAGDGALIGPAVPLKRIEPVGLTAVTTRGSGGHVPPMVAPMTKPTKQSAFKQLQDRAEQLRKEGHASPMLSAMAEHPDLALIAEGRDAPLEPLKASAAAVTTRDAAGANLVRMVNELSASTGRTRGDCWTEIILKNPSLVATASRG